MWFFKIWIRQNIEQNTSDRLKPTLFASRFLNTTEERYSVNKLELLRFVWSVHYLKYYLIAKISQ